jgi:hypothetical protein
MKNYISIDKKDCFKEEKFEDVWLITIKNFFNNEKPKVRLIKRAEELNNEKILKKDLQEEILEILRDKSNNQPKNPYMKREKLIEKLNNYNETEIDSNVWFLKEKGIIKKVSYLGAKERGYSKVKLR